MCCPICMYGLLTKCEVKMAGVDFHKLSKKELGQFQAISTEQAWSTKDLLYGCSENYFCGQYSSILPAWVANHSAGFDSSCPLTELAI